MGPVMSWSTFADTATNPSYPYSYPSYGPTHLVNFICTGYRIVNSRWPWGKLTAYIWLAACPHIATNTDPGGPTDRCFTYKEWSFSMATVDVPGGKILYPSISHPMAIFLNSHVIPHSTPVSKATPTHLWYQKPAPTARALCHSIGAGVTSVLHQAEVMCYHPGFKLRDDHARKIPRAIC